MELSIIDPEVAEAVHGPRSKCTKTIFYDVNWPRRTVQEQRDKGLHDKRRRTAWDPAFSMKCEYDTFWEADFLLKHDLTALRTYDSRVTGYSDELANQLGSFSGKPVNVSDWFMYYGFDVMGDLAFGKSFDMLKQGEHHPAIKIMHDSVKPVGVVGHASWIINLLKAIPGMADPIHRFETYSEEAVQERIKTKPNEPDVMSHILAAEPLYTNPQMQRWLEFGDSKLIIIAGSDTTATTLAFAFYHLAHDPSEVAKLREELQGVPMGADFSVRALQDLKHLNGVVMETLRLHPPVPSFLHRLTPPEGLQVGDRYIPGNTQVYTPPWSIQRCKFTSSFLISKYSTYPFTSRLDSVAASTCIVLNPTIHPQCYLRYGLKITDEANYSSESLCITAQFHPRTVVLEAGTHQNASGPLSHLWWHKCL